MDTSAAGTVEAIDLTGKPRPLEVLIQGSMFLAGLVSILTTIGIVIVLGREALLFFQTDEVTLGEFFGSTTWEPQILEFGIWPLVRSTMMVSLIAVLVAVPLGLATAMSGGKD